MDRGRGRISVPRWSVRARILASILAVAAVGMAVAGTTAYLVQRERVLSQVDQHLSRTVSDVEFVASGRPLAGGSAAVTYASLREVLRATVQQIVPDHNEGTLGLVDGRPAYAPGGTVTVQPARDAQFVARVVAEVDATGQPPSAVRGTAATSVGTLRYVAVPIHLAGDPETGVFFAAYDLDAELSEIGDAFRTYALVALLALVAIGLVGWFVAGRLLRPIRRLRETAARISASDLSERIPVSGRDDVSDLTVTVNGMLDRLDTAVSSQRRLLDDVGHELKTPLTIVRGHLELMDVADGDDVAATRGLVLDELDRMAGLVNDIALLASVQRPHAITAEPVDLAELTERVALKASALGDQTWVAEAGANAVVTLDTDRITQAWLQLAANAARHAPTGSTVRIGSAVDGEVARLWVTDEGPGIPAGAQQRIFERFRRVDDSRGEQGSGLGLAIVAAIAAAHGGTVSVQSSVGVGSTFTIELPLDGLTHEREESV
jgi:signal transduction histidine kinase